MEVIELENGSKILVGKGIGEYYPPVEQEFSEEVMRIVRGTNMYQNCQNSKKKEE